MNKNSVHDSYEIQREGRVSRNPVIFILDLLCQRIGENTTVLFVVGWILCAVSAIIAIFFVPSYWLFCSFIPVLLSQFGVASVYRWHRHRYLKKHDLPGPNGWGTIDMEPTKESHSRGYNTKSSDFEDLYYDYTLFSRFKEHDIALIVIQLLSAFFVDLFYVAMTDIDFAVIFMFGSCLIVLPSLVLEYAIIPECIGFSAMQIGKKCLTVFCILFGICIYGLILYLVYTKDCYLFTISSLGIISALRYLLLKANSFKNFVRPIWHLMLIFIGLVPLIYPIYRLVFQFLVLTNG